MLALGVSTNETQADFKFFFEALKNTVLEIFLESLEINTLISDCSKALINGFLSVFPNSKNIICWAHVKMNFKKQRYASSEHKKLLLKDIDNLQLCPNQEAFNKASTLLYEKWLEQEEDVMKYIKKNWFRRNNSWFEGVQNCTPSTNNCVEGTNARIKLDFTFRERPRFSKFKDRIMEIVHKTSIEYKENVKQISFESKINKITWNKAYKWATKPKFVQSNVTDSGTKYLIPSGDREKITKAEIERYNNLVFNSFEDYQEVMFSIWELFLPTDLSKWRQGTCTCPIFFKQYVCKHLVGMALRLKLVRLPPNIITIDTKRGRGRPPLAASALIKD